mmetsp:Transcript_8651/g.18618  ORF Transcript_8651/g.18618 Transcript_8651/m.18618 type:complete len:91 (+) Transcript_8651:61-333(+)
MPTAQLLPIDTRRLHGSGARDAGKDDDKKSAEKNSSEKMPGDTHLIPVPVPVLVLHYCRAARCTFQHTPLYLSQSLVDVSSTLALIMASY